MVEYGLIGFPLSHSFSKKYFAEKFENVIFGGRLAEYKYYDMHQVVGSALQKSKKYLE